jgi:hypothetical protein
MLSHMAADNKDTPRVSQAELNDALEGRIVDIFVWLLTDEMLDQTA